MRVVYILSVSWGGIPHYTAELANAVSRYCDVVVLKPKDSNDELFSENVEVINAFKPMYFSIKRKTDVFTVKNVTNFFSYRNIKQIHKTKPDIIHFPELYPQSSVFTLLYRIHKKYPIVCTLHAVSQSTSSMISSPLTIGDFIYGLLASISEFTKYLIKPDAIIVHTKRDKSCLLHKQNSKRIFVIPHGIYTFFKKYCKNINNIGEEKCILIFGRAIEDRGIKYLIDAAPKVFEKVPDAKIIIAGEGSSRYIDYILSKIGNYKSKFELYDAFIPNEKVAELFLRSNVVVCPQIRYIGGWSGSLMVALGFGKPIIVTNVMSYLQNILKNKRDCLIVPPKDPEALAEAIITLLKDEKLRKKMSENALKRAEELSWDNIAKMHIKVYEEVLNERRKRN